MGRKPPQAAEVQTFSTCCEPSRSYTAPSGSREGRRVHGQLFFFVFKLCSGIAAFTNRKCRPEAEDPARAAGLTVQVDELQVVGQRHGFGVADTQAVGQGCGVAYGAAHFLSNLQKEREKNLMALPSEVRLHPQLCREEVGVISKNACLAAWLPWVPCLLYSLRNAIFVCSLKQDFSFRIAAQGGCDPASPGRCVGSPTVLCASWVPIRTLPF